MKKIKIILYTIIALTVSTNYNCQSTSVFDANYFNKDNTAPPIKVGKGFHINDVYKQTRGCFTAETCKQTNLAPQQTGGKKTTIKVFHIKTNEEFNSFRKTGTSGKISFLNLFSFGGQTLEEYANKTIHDEERVIFSANVDFGIYSFDTEPQLSEEAKVLIEQKKLQDFVNFFGTHYISGVRKESSINVIITKEEDENSNSRNEEYGMSASGKNPTGVKGSIEAQSTDKINNILKSGKFTAIVEINGPAVQSDLKGQITKILNGNSDAKADAIAAIVEGAMKNISDPAQSITTQYYYSPFSLYGLDGIYWDGKKQNELIKLNEAIVDVYSSKTLLSEMITESGKKQFLEALGNDNTNEENTAKFLAAYNKSMPTLVTLNNKADTYLKDLEAKYNKCADVYCTNTATCCANDNYLKEIEKFDFYSKVEKEQTKLLESVIAVVAEVYALECQKKKQGIINIQNFSSNPYSLYQDGKLLQVIQGKETVTFNVPLGEYSFKAVQNSGYLVYPTENIRTANIVEVCQEKTLKIGFED